MKSGSAPGVKDVHRGSNTTEGSGASGSVGKTPKNCPSDARYCQMAWGLDRFSM